MSLTKIVNGKTVFCTPEEEAEIRAGWEAAATVVPRVVSMRQARLALLAEGKLSAVHDAINALPSPQKEAAQIEWEYSNEVRRDQPLVLLLAPALGLDESGLDSLFIEAAQL